MADNTEEVHGEKNCAEMIHKMGKHCHHGHRSHGSDAVYGIGIIGAAVYFIGQSTDFWTGVLGLLKAIVWPAYLVYYALKFFVQ
jgi:hypothetical protein